jgi:hypothetical protein
MSCKAVIDTPVERAVKESRRVNALHAKFRKKNARRAYIAGVLRNLRSTLRKTLRLGSMAEGSRDVHKRQWFAYVVVALVSVPTITALTVAHLNYEFKLPKFVKQYTEEVIEEPIPTLVNIRMLPSLDKAQPSKEAETLNRDFSSLSDTELDSPIVLKLTPTIENLNLKELQ